MKKQSAKVKLNTSALMVFAIVAIIIVILVANVLYTSQRRHFKEMSQFETMTVASQMSSLLLDQKKVVDMLAHNPQIKAWYLDENNPLLAEAAFKVIDEYRQLMFANTVFVTIDASHHYFMSIEDSEEGARALRPLGTLDRSLKDDLWYFTLEEQSDMMMLNVDRDRYYHELRLWFNQKVLADGQMIGAIGTGIRLDQINDFIRHQVNTKVKATRVINQYGMIQLSQDYDEIKENSFGQSQLLESSIYKLPGLTDSKLLIENFIEGQEPQMMIESKDTQGLYILHKVEGTNLIVVNHYENRFSHDYQLIIGVILLILTLMFILLMVYRFLVKSLYIRPLDHLINGIEIENHEILEVAQRPDEWGTLALSIQNMLMKLSKNNQVLIEDVEKRTHELKNAYQKIEANELKLQELVNSIPVGIFMLNQHKELVYANPEFLRMYQFSDLAQLKKALKGQLLSFFGSEKDLKNYVEAIKRLKDTEKIALVVRDHKGQAFWAEITLRHLGDNDYDWLIEGTVVNIQSQKDYEMDLYQLATKDRLTQIYNRHYFDKMIREEIQRNDRYPLALSLIVFDLDHFKRVNDKWGHDKGDDILKGVSQIVTEGIRTSDIFARWGGEEFVILCPHTTQVQATHVAEKLRHDIEKATIINGIKVTSSFGVAERLRFEDYDSWFRRADQALYAAKKSGRNQVSACEWITEDANHLTQLVWDQSFEFGIDEMDIAHQRIFYLSNSLFDKIRKKESAKEVFEQIIQESIAHFKDEEEEMLKTGYERYLTHQTAHREILEKINKIYHRYLIQDVTVEEIYSFVSNEMLVNHILIEDGDFASYLSDDESL